MKCHFSSCGHTDNINVGRGFQHNLGVANRAHATCMEYILKYLDINVTRHTRDGQLSPSDTTSRRSEVRGRDGEKHLRPYNHHQENCGRKNKKTAISGPSRLFAFHVAARPSPTRSSRMTRGMSADSVTKNWMLPPLQTPLNECKKNTTFFVHEIETFNICINNRENVGHVLESFSEETVENSPEGHDNSHYARFSRLPLANADGGACCLHENAVDVTLEHRRAVRRHELLSYGTT